MLSILFAASLAISGPATAEPEALSRAATAKLAMWRLDCGKYLIHNLGGKGPRELSIGCYLIRHGDSYMLWDAGVPRNLIGKPDVSKEQTISLDTSLVDQLGTLGVRPEQITWLGVSHYHGDHIGQAADFARATLLMGSEDFDALAAKPANPDLEPQLIEPWLAGRAPLVRITRDHDVFGDGRVTVLTMPGHTPGHTALLVRLNGGSYLLTGDLYHFADQIPESRVSGNATDPAAARRSMARFQQIARETGATIIVQHEPGDIAKLPAFPAGAQ